jgi:hypothetical protein
MSYQNLPPIHPMGVSYQAEDFAANLRKISIESLNKFKIDCPCILPPASSGIFAKDAG